MSDFSPEHYYRIEPGYYDKVFRRGAGVQWFWHHVRFRKVAEALPGEVRSLLDLGCGPGTFLGSAGRRFRPALGLDLAPGQIAYARETYRRDGLDFRAEDVTKLSAAERFDGVVSIEVIEHLSANETSSFLRRIFTVVRPGGWVVLTTPNYRSLWPLLERVVSRVGPVDYRQQHINRFTVARLERELLDAGFEDVECGTFFVLAPFLAALSTGLAEAVLKLESRLLPRLGSEIIVRARRPAQ